MTPFDTVEFETGADEVKINKADSNKPIITEQVHDAIMSVTVINAISPNCPNCQGEMVERVAKKGARQGQIFYGCSQFPQCRGVINKN